jgi:transcriptional regulator with XRE-family HTH domain
MSKTQPDSQFKAMFLARTALAREKAGYTQESMAEALGMDQSKYSKYEIRTELPHHLVIPFCSLCNVTTAWLFTAVVEVREPKPRRRRTRRRLKAA